MIVLVAALAAAAPEPTEPPDSTVVLGGLLFSAGNQGTGIGGEASLVYWPTYNRTNVFGAWAQAETGTRAARIGAGLEASSSLLGAEIGWSRRFANADHVATDAIHLEPYFTLALLNFGLRLTLPVGAGDGKWGSEVAFVVSLKGFGVLAGKEPDPIRMNMPHGRPVRDARGDAIEPPFARGPALLHPEADEWIARGRKEQASVASFLRLAAELALHGAPRDLIEDCHRAAFDEIAHARHCFARAAEIAGAPVFPGDLHVPPPRAVDLATLARESQIDGCEGEAASAQALEREGLLQMAAEERAHAELASRIVAFCTARG